MDVIGIALDTLDCIKQGYYVTSSGERIDIRDSIKKSVSQTQYFEPEGLEEIVAEVLKRPGRWPATKIDFRIESTLTGAKDLVNSGRFSRVGVLNFAAALSPGGRFLAGAQAQEETLARSSALYSTLVQCPEYYRFHQAQENPFYSDRMIYSPVCPVFKDDGGAYLERPYLVDFLTSPAPYAGFVAPGDGASRRLLGEIFQERGKMVLALFASMQCDALVLGAWGCGAFCNSPEMVSQMFARYLGELGAFSGHFDYVRFSILHDAVEDRNYTIFRRAFEKF